MKIITILAVLSIMPLLGCTQTATKNVVDKNKIAKYEQKVTNKDFAAFLKRFTNTGFILNCKDSKNRPASDNSLPQITTRQEALRYFKFKESETICEEMDFNYDTEEVKYSKVDCLPYCDLKFFSDDFIGLVYGKNMGIDVDTSLVYLCTFTYDGKMIDKVQIGEQFTREDDWISSVLLDEFHFKVFYYETNWNNFTGEPGAYRVIDETAPMTKLMVRNYEISAVGKISETGNAETFLLKNNLVDYKSYKKVEDDPMNDY